MDPIRRQRLGRLEALQALSVIGPLPPAPPGTGETVLEVPFNLATPSPLFLSLIAAGQIVNRAVLLITTPFNDAGATLRLGTPFSPSLIMAAGDSKPSVAGQYESDFLVQFLAPDTLQLSITPGASTLGSGVVLLKFR